MGRRRGISSTERAFRERFAEELQAAIGSNRGAASAAAKKLGISRQAIFLYLNSRATPGAEVVRRVCQLFKLSLNVKGQIVSESSYRKTSRERPQNVPPLQLPLLPDAIRALNNEQLEIEVLNKIGDSVDLKVRINFSKLAG